LSIQYTLTNKERERKMEQQAREYFVRRLNEIAQEKVQAKAVALFGATGRPEQPTWGMVFEGIASGEITLKEEKRDYTGPYLNPSMLCGLLWKQRSQSWKPTALQLHVRSNEQWTPVCWTQTHNKPLLLSRVFNSG
jgi:hypothetical protein